MTAGEPWADGSDSDIGWIKVFAIIDELPVGKSPGSWREPAGDVVEFRRVPQSFQDRVNDWMAACYEERVLVTFDWGAWTSEGDGVQYIQDPFAVRDADLQTLRKVLTAHLRADRFVEGHLLAVADDGTLRILLEAMRDRVTA